MSSGSIRSSAERTSPARSKLDVIDTSNPNPVTHEPLMETEKYVAAIAPKGPAPPAGPVDGGLICWMQVLGSFAIWTNTWGLVNAFGEFQTYYERSLPHITPSQISWIGSIQAFLLMSLGIVSGPLYDAGYFRHLCIFGNFMVVLGIMMTSIAKEYWQILLAQGIVSGIGYGMLFIPGVAILPQYFVKKKALANGIASIGSGVGGVIYPIMLHRLVPIIGFGWTVRVIGFIALFLGIVIVATMKNRLPPREMRRLIDFSFFHDTPLTIYAASLLSTCIAVYVPVFYIGGYSLAYGITTPELAFYLLPILQAANILGRLVPNFWSDKIGPVNLAIPSVLITSILSFAWIGIRNQAGLLVYAILYGVFFGIVQSLPPSCIVTLVTDMKTLGSKMGTAFFLASFGTLIGTPISGAILQGTGSYVGVQVFAAIVLAVGATLVLAARVTKVGWGIVKQ